MPKLRILQENLPTRCEICHQSDLFNPQTGDCKRCSKIAKRLKNQAWHCISHPNDAGVLQVFGALLIFGVHIYFLPYAQMFMQDFWLTCGIYFSSLIVGLLLIVCGKGRPIF
ncbi:MAG: hypothetical protein IPK14_15410 [Blastocatellia bacterium]|nr:hypothetical protein [Blastocatellia bacterium]MBL8196393.1 hypothetical protein [Blastocatellia bacterium]MBN8725872.1 hypothetical protein [Acidobacteriota bacterium]